MAVSIHYRENVKILFKRCAATIRASALQQVDETIPYNVPTFDVSCRLRGERGDPVPSTGELPAIGKTLDPSAQPPVWSRGRAGGESHSELAMSDEKDTPFSVRNEKVNAMLLNEFKGGSRGSRPDKYRHETGYDDCAATKGDCFTHRSPRSAGRADLAGERPA